jgi:hypothetical protein
MNSSYSIKVSNDAEICQIAHIKGPQLTKNHQTNLNAKHFMETILLSIMISIIIKQNSN